MRFARVPFQPMGALLWSVLLVCAVWPGYAFAAPNPFAEVPADHWSYGALERLRSVVLGERGAEGVRLATRLTRVEMAIEVGEIVDTLVRTANETTLAPRLMHTNLEAIVDAYNATVPPEQRLAGEDVRLAEDLIVHYRSELEALGYRIKTNGQGYLGLDALTRALGRLQLEGESQKAAAPAPVSGAADVRPLGSLQPLGLSLRMLPSGTPGAEEDLWLLPLSSQDGAGPSDGVVARFGELAGEGWEELALVVPRSTAGLQGGGVKLGQLGSTALIARRSNDSSFDYVAGLDGTVELDRLTVGATVLRLFKPLDDPTVLLADQPTVAGVEGSYRLMPGLVVTAGLAGTILGQQTAGLVKIGGVLRLSDSMSLEAVYRLQDAGFAIAASGDDAARQAFDLAFDLGYARVTAGVDRQLRAVSDEEAPKTTTTTSLGLLYPVNELAVLRASREEALAEGPTDAARSATTQLGVDLSIPRMNLSIKLGYALIERWSAQTDPSAAGRASEAELGVEYQLAHGSIALRYKVITGDVGELGGPEGSNVGAELTIRF